jgi:hypothetical protein
LFISFTISTLAFAQEDAWVYFKDKPSATFSKYPSKMLTQRALDRAAQNIAVNYKDVPIETDYVNQIKAIAGIEVKAKSKV